MIEKLFRLISISCLAAPLLAGCAVLDNAIDGRARTVNGASGDYASVAILTNIIRASRYEPLNFVSLTGYTGHDTFNSGLPSFVLPPANPVAVGFGSSTASTVLSNDFNVSVLDDPSSYAALLEPVNPALMGLFIKAGYPRELIYLLFFEYIKDKDKNGTVSTYFNFPEPIKSDVDESYDCHKHEKGRLNFYKTICKIESLIEQGLTIEIDSDLQPSADVIQSYELCFDRGLLVPIFEPFNKGYYGDPQARDGETPSGKLASPQCDQPDSSHKAYWTTAQGSSATGTLAIVRPHGFKAPVVVNLPHERRASYTVLDDDGEVLEIHTRSVLGAYQYLGQILHQQFKHTVLRYADTTDFRFFEPLPVNDGTCFAAVSTDDATYCVPNSAANTKRVFSLLRQLVGLLTKPNNQPATQTTRTTPN